MQRSIWITHEDWELIKTHAALVQKSLSQYLLHLHKMNITSRGITPQPAAIHFIQAPNPVVDESDIKIPSSVDVGTQDWRDDKKPNPKPGQDKKK